MAIKKVTLARPDPAIVGEMVPFLKELGISVEQLTDIRQLKHTVTASTDAVVISLAMASTVSASVDRVLNEVMQLNPGVKLIFSSVLPLNKKHKNLSYLLSRFLPKAAITSFDYSEARVKGQRVLYICSDDLKHASRRRALGEVIIDW